MLIRELRLLHYEEWRCRRELHPRMGVLQTPALLLGYGTNTHRLSEQRTCESPRHDASYSGCTNVELLRMSSTSLSTLSSMNMGTAAVTV